MNEKEILSFATYKLEYPVSSRKECENDALHMKIKEFLSYPCLPNVLFSKSEIADLEKKHNVSDIKNDKIIDMMKHFGENSAKTIEILEILNLIILKKGFAASIELFDQCKIHFALPSLICQCDSVQAKELILNVICVCIEHINNGLEEIFVRIFEIMLASSGLLMKKSLITLSLLLVKMFPLKEESVKLTHMFVPSSGSKDIPVLQNFDYLVNGSLPNSMIVGENIVGHSTMYPEALNYQEHCQIDSKSRNLSSRSIFQRIGKYIPMISHFLIPKVNKFYNSSVDNTDCITYSSSGSALIDEKNADNLIITCSILSFLYLILDVLAKSNFFDADVFAHFISKEQFSSSLMQLTSNSFENHRYGFFLFSEGTFSLNELSLALAFRVSTISMGLSPYRVASAVNEKSILSLSQQCSSIASPLIKSESASLLARCIRWIPKVKEDLDYAKFMNFVYLNLCQYEVFEKWSAESNPVPAPLIQTKYLSTLIQHCASCGIEISESW